MWFQKITGKRHGLGKIGAGFRVVILEPGDLEHRQSGPLIPDYGVIGFIPGASDFTKELMYLVWENALIAQPAETVVSAFIRLEREPDTGRSRPGEGLGELPQLKKAGVWVLGKVVFRQQPDAQKLLIVLLKLGKVAGE